MKKLYIDKWADNGNTGVTTKRKKIVYNCDLIQKGLSDQLTDQLTTSDHASTFKIAGRYICLITLSLSNKSIMVIRNLGRDEKELKDILKGIAIPQYKEIAKLAFEALKNDDSGYYDFELEVGSVPE